MKKYQVIYPSSYSVKDPRPFILHCSRRRKLLVIAVFLIAENALLWSLYILIYIFFYNVVFTSANHWIIVASVRCAQYQDTVSKSCHNISRCEVYEVCNKEMPNCFAMVYKFRDGRIKLNMAKCMECQPSSDRECIMSLFSTKKLVEYFSCCCSQSECNKNIVFNENFTSTLKPTSAVCK